MNILEKRKIKSDLYDIIKHLEIFETKLKLAGSASLMSQQYFSDYDFNCKIRVKRQTPIFNEFKRVLTYTNDKLYFIEFKIEYIDGKKLKLYNVNDLRLHMFKNISFVKIDYIVFLDYVFKEVSIMYIFNSKKEKEEIIKTLRNDYDDLMTKGENFKALKRLFSIYKIEKDYPNMKNLTALFNSNMGKLYQLNSNLKTIMLLKTMYDDELTKKRIDINLKFLRIEPNSDLNELIKTNDETLNNITVTKKNNYHRYI
jgi:hypothetical protein